MKIDKIKKAKRFSFFFFECLGFQRSLVGFHRALTVCARSKSTRRPSATESLLTDNLKKPPRAHSKASFTSFSETRWHAQEWKDHERYMSKNILIVCTKTLKVNHKDAHIDIHFLFLANMIFQRALLKEVANRDSASEKHRRRYPGLSLF